MMSLTFSELSAISNSSSWWVSPEIYLTDAVTESYVTRVRARSTSPCRRR
jgi:hypothetical protein